MKLFDLFPQLTKENHEITSPRTIRYNCIAWAAGATDRWWQPGVHWPVEFYHAVQRTVRRAWLCGLDPVSGKSFEHRRTWIQNRLQELAAIFGIDCLSFAVMVNHVQIRRGNKKGRIPSDLAPILERTGLSGELWCDLVNRLRTHNQDLHEFHRFNKLDGPLLTSNSLVTAGVAGGILTLDYQTNRSGSATITVIATDRSGARANLTFTVVVLSPAQQGNVIIQLIRQWQSDSKINAGVANSMIVKVENVLKSYDKDNLNAAGNQLNALKNEINAKIKSGSLTTAVAVLAFRLIDALRDSMTP